jgi:hypothetical protein
MPDYEIRFGWQEMTTDMIYDPSRLSPYLLPFWGSDIDSREENIFLRSLPWLRAFP